MKRTYFQKIAAAVVVGAVLLTAGCDMKSTDLMKEIVPNDISVQTVNLKGENAVSATDFAVSLFRHSMTEGNTLLSPVSVLYALAMTANGANGETLSQMEDTLGMTVDEMNLYLKAYMDALSETEKCKLGLANAIWFRENSIVPNEDFLQTNADYYGAGIYAAPFDSSTVKDINNWVKENTDGMIDKILEKISSDTVMYLVNAFAFDAEWAEIYENTDIHNGVFTSDKGETQNASMMHSTEDVYLDDGNATGFIKYYADHKYAFAALLPKEGMSISDYVDTLTGESLNVLLLNPQSCIVQATMPKFKTEYAIELNDILEEMGMKNAFNPSLSDFSKMSAESDIHIGKVIHKTAISVNERGTKAGAATAVGMECGVAVIDQKNVTLDRPFVYMIIDCEANLPIFMGTMTSLT